MILKNDVVVGTVYTLWKNIALQRRIGVVVVSTISWIVLWLMTCLYCVNVNNCEQKCGIDDIVLFQSSIKKVSILYLFESWKKIILDVRIKGWFADY